LCEAVFSGVDEFGTDLVTQSPNDPTLAAGATDAFQQEDELLRHLHAFGEKPYAAIRDVGD
jgi:hypothetical protein